jgi:EmrB/QacA subfamily drug resistance transporter
MSQSDDMHVSSQERMSGKQVAMLLCCAGAPFMTMLDTNIVAVSLPSIARDLHGEFTDVEWVVSAYILPYAGLLIPAGALADRLGRRRVLFAGLVLFTLASVLCGVAPSLLFLNLSRALQAVGGSLLLTASLAVVAHGFAPHQRSRVYAIYAMVMGIAPSLGAILGGLITSFFGWRWGFLINFPIGLVLLAVGMTSIGESRDPQANRLDLLEIALFGAGLFATVWPLIEANRVGWGSSQTVIKLTVGAILIVAFLVYERRHPRPMIDLSLFNDRGFIGATTSMLGYAVAGHLMMTILPVYLQDAFGQSAAHAGLAMIPFALPLFAGPAVGAKLTTHLSNRALLSVGLAGVALGDFVLAGAVMGQMGYETIAVGMFIVGLATGVLNGETTKAQVTAVPPERAGMASGIASTTRFIGFTIGLAGLGAVLASSAEKSLVKAAASHVASGSVEWHRLSLRIVGGDAQGALSDLPSNIRAVLDHAVHVSVTTGFAATFTAAACFGVLTSALAWILVRTARPGPPAKLNDALYEARAEAAASDQA